MVHETLDSEDQDFLKVLTIWVWRPSLPYDQDHFTHLDLCPLFPRRLHTKCDFDWSCGFREEDV